MAKAGEVTDELRQIYKEAWEDGIWIKEFGGGEGCMAGAGDVADIERLEKELGREIDVNDDLTLGDCVLNIPSLPGGGDTREEACRDAVAEWKAYREKNKA